MGWETRKNGKSYYYHPVRVGNRVVKQYFGAGVEAELAAELVERQKQNRQLDREKLAAAKKSMKLLDRQMDQLARAPLDAINDDRTKPSEAAQPVSTPPDILKRAQELLRAREAGDQSAETQLVEMVDRFPCLMHRLGDVAGLARMRLVSLITGKDPVFQKAVINKVEHLRSQFPVNDDPIGKLLVERVLATWLRLNFLEGKEGEVGGRDPKTFEIYSRLASKAQREHTQAIQNWTLWKSCKEEGSGD